MKSSEKIRKQEIEKCKTCTDYQIKNNLKIYNVFKIFFSRPSMFVYYAILVFIISSLMTFPITIKVISGLITHFILFIVIDPLISKWSGVEDAKNEIDILIKVNKEILAERDANSQIK
jgi:hypothetical protein